MGLRRVAALITVAGGALLVLAASLLHPIAGIAIAGCLLTVAGVAALRGER